MNKQPVTIGQRIGQELERMEWTPKDLERRTWQMGHEVDEQKIRRWLKGQKVWAEDIPVVADVLDIPLDDLIRGPEWREPLLDFTGQQDPQLAGATT